MVQAATPYYTIEKGRNTPCVVLAPILPWHPPAPATPASPAVAVVPVPLTTAPPVLAVAAVPTVPVDAAIPPIVPADAAGSAPAVAANRNPSPVPIRRAAPYRKGAVWYSPGGSFHFG